ncbi:MAG TPA: enoyl-CoA hydratase/isomerase family protein [Candidatus Dormibacteraeota bacterium]
MRDLHLEVVGGVAMLVIDRPGARNALALQTMDELDEALETVRLQRARVLVIRGAGDKAFCAGGDIKELEGMRSESEAAAMAHRMRATLAGYRSSPSRSSRASTAMHWAGARSSQSHAIFGSRRSTRASDSRRSRWG